jgi:hypothetical protein
MVLTSNHAVDVADSSLPSITGPKKRELWGGIFRRITGTPKSLAQLIP